MKECIQKPFNNLKKQIEKFQSDEIDVNELKKTTAGYGIYPQNNDLFMIRIRLTGGEIKLDKLKIVRQIIKKYNVPYIRLTTRQDIQLHNIRKENINFILDDLVAAGFIFRGGGGDTFRNITVSYDSGLTETSVFDVTPYSEKMTEIIYCEDKAYALPRKIKIAFSSDFRDGAFAKWSDIGFIAKINDNSKKGFEVYIGGGIGRNSSEAVKIFDFLETENCVSAAVAMINLFNDHGNRDNRAKARIRYIKEKYGEAKFKELYLEYYNQVSDQYLIKEPEVKKYFEVNNTEKVACNWNSAGYNSWKTVFTEDAEDNNFKIVRLPVNRGNLNLEDLDFILEVCDKLNIKWLRINRVHEFICVVLKEQLGTFYKSLSSYKDEIFTKVDFGDRITSCIGTKVCPIGLIDSQEFASEVSKALNTKLADNITDVYNYIINGISISGCGNSCGNSEVFAIAGKGTRKKIDGERQEVCCLNIKKEIISDASEDIVEEFTLSNAEEKLNSILSKLKL